MDINWEPRIGDPTFMGWFTVAAYFGAALLCLAACLAIRRRIPMPARGRQAVVWGATAALMAALSINKELDLQSFVTAVGRALAYRDGWIEERRRVQFAIMIVFTMLSAAAVAYAAWRVRARRREYWLLLAGVSFTLTFIVVRAASFHHFDVLIGTYVAGVKMNWVLELTGIALVSIAAVSRLLAAQRRPILRRDR